jgi:DKNYY family
MRRHSQILHGAYARDDRRVFISQTKIVDADLSSLRPLDGPYANDYGRVYWMGKTIDGASPNTFRILNTDFQYSTPDRYAYYRRSIIGNADPRTFPPDPAVTNCAKTSISFTE